MLSHTMLFLERPAKGILTGVSGFSDSKYSSWAMMRLLTWSSIGPAGQRSSHDTLENALSIIEIMKLGNTEWKATGRHR
jgi:hypothetical protein